MLAGGSKDGPCVHRPRDGVRSGRERNGTVEERLRSSRPTRTSGSHPAERTGRPEELESRVAELGAAVQAPRGYVGSVRAVGEGIERRAERAFRKARPETVIADARYRAPVIEFGRLRSPGFPRPRLERDRITAKTYAVVRGAPPRERRPHRSRVVLVVSSVRVRRLASTRSRYGSSVVPPTVRPNTYRRSAPNCSIPR